MKKSKIWLIIILVVIIILLAIFGWFYFVKEKPLLSSIPRQSNPAPSDPAMPPIGSYCNNCGDCSMKKVGDPCGFLWLKTCYSESNPACYGVTCVCS